MTKEKGTSELYTRTRVGDEFEKCASPTQKITRKGTHLGRIWHSVGAYIIGHGLSQLSDRTKGADIITSRSPFFLLL